MARPTLQVMPVLWSVFILTVGNPLTFWNTMQHPLHLGGFSANTDTFHCIATATTSTNSTAGWLTTSGSHFQLAGTSCFIVGSQGVRYCIYLMGFNRFLVLRHAHQWATPYFVLSRSYGYWTLYQINNFLFILYYYYTCFLWFCQQVFASFYMRKLI